MLVVKYYDPEYEIKNSTERKTITLIKNNTLFVTRKWFFYNLK